MIETDSRHQQARNAYNSNTPLIEPGQYWSARSVNNEVLRRIRIIAEYPAEYGFCDYAGRAWIFEDHAAKLKTRVGQLGVTPEFNLRYVFELERETDV